MNSVRTSPHLTRTRDPFVHVCVWLKTYETTSMRVTFFKSRIITMATCVSPRTSTPRTSLFTSTLSRTTRRVGRMAVANTPAESWRKVMIKGDLQKGDAPRPKNYRPICTLSTLYKVFSTLLYNRLCSRLDRLSPPTKEGSDALFKLWIT